MTVSRDVAATPQQIWACLASPESYSRWVAGTFKILRADRNWPAPGTQLHHRWGVGLWRVSDTSTVLAAHEPHRIDLLASARPFGIVRAEVRVIALTGGSRIVIEEEILGGWAAGWPRLSRVVQRLRNRRSARRLAALAITMPAAQPAEQTP